MSGAYVKFFKEDCADAQIGEEQVFSFTCPMGRNKKRRCGMLLIAGKTDIKRDGQNKNGGEAQWDWNGNRDEPTFTPSINCSGCWHGYIRLGRCVDVHGKDEPEILDV